MQKRREAEAARVVYNDHWWHPRMDGHTPARQNIFRVLRATTYDTASSLYQMLQL